MICFSFFSLRGQTAVSHKILNGKLKKSSFKKLVKKARSADVVFFGEIHDDAISHWLQLKLVKELDKDHEVVIGMEMFERDMQKALNAFMQSEIDLETLEDTVSLWNNYKTDYAPIVEYAKENNISVVASNIPRKYARQVYKGGFEVLNQLSEEERSYVAPLPVPYDAELPGYQNMLKMVEGHGGDNFPKAQAIKDATMAYSISETVLNNAKYVHLNGKYHSDNKEGIIWYLNQYKPKLKIMTITVLRGNDEEIKRNVADFLILVDEDMLKTF